MILTSNKSKLGTVRKILWRYTGWFVRYVRRNLMIFFCGKFIYSVLPCLHRLEENAERGEKCKYYSEILIFFCSSVLIVDFVVETGWNLDFPGLINAFVRLKGTGIKIKTVISSNYYTPGSVVRASSRLNRDNFYSFKIKAFVDKK